MSDLSDLWQRELDSEENFKTRILDNDTYGIINESKQHLGNRNIPEHSG